MAQCVQLNSAACPLKIFEVCFMAPMFDQFSLMIGQERCHGVILVWISQSDTNLHSFWKVTLQGLGEHEYSQWSLAILKQDFR